MKKKAKIDVRIDHDVLSIFRLICNDSNKTISDAIRDYVESCINADKLITTTRP